LDELNRLKLGQDKTVEVLKDMYQGSGRNIGGVQTLPDGSKAVLSRRIGPNQPILVVAPDGTVRPATGTIELSGDLANPVKVTDIKF
jgi:hypothetical protein